MSVPTISDVARRAGVSVSTASDILNGKLKARPKTAARVRCAAADLGYRPNALARRLRTARAEAFGLVVPYRRSIFTSALLTDLLSGIQAAQGEAGLHLVLAAGRYERPGEAYGADLVASRAVDGLIVIGTRESYGRDLDADVRALRALGCPLVWLHYYDGTEPVDRVVRGAEGGGAHAALFAHLRQRGHGRVGFLTPGLGLPPGTRPQSAPALGLLEPLGLGTRPAWWGAGEAHDGGAFRAALEILRAPERPNALVCEGDDLAVAALQAALGLGLRVPQDVAIASTHNYSLGERAAVPLTTFGPPASALGRRAVLRIVERLANPALPPEVLEVPGGLVVRAST